MQAVSSDGGWKPFDEFYSVYREYNEDLNWLKITVTIEKHNIRL